MRLSYKTSSRLVPCTYVFYAEMTREDLKITVIQTFILKFPLKKCLHAFGSIRAVLAHLVCNLIAKFSSELFCSYKC